MKGRAARTYGWWRKEAAEEDVSSRGVLKAFLVEAVADLAASTAFEVVLDMAVAGVEVDGGVKFEEGKSYRSI